MSARPAMLVVAAATTALLSACSAPDARLTYTVERRAFEHRVTAEGHLEAERSTQITVPSGVDGRVRLAWLAPEGARVAAGDVVARFDGSGMQHDLDEGRSELESARHKVSQAEVESESRLADLEKEAQVATLELDVAQRFQKTDAEIFSHHEIVESEIDEELARERKDHADASRRTESALAETEVELLEIEERRARLKIDQARRGLEALEVRAPHGGVLSLLSNRRGEPLKVGAELWRGQAIAEIPDLSKLEAEVYVLEADAGGLEVGRPATVVVEAHPETSYRATIRRVDTVAQPRFRGSPVQYFGVTLELERTDAETMKPGQRVRAELLLERVEDALVVPRQAVYQSGGASWVQVRGGAGFEPRRVEVAVSSLGLMVVSEGLSSGDVVALDPPAIAAAAPAAAPAGALGRVGG